MNISRLALLAPVLLAGCQEDVHFADSMDLVFDFGPLGTFGELHTPYVRGAGMRLRVDLRPALDPADFTLEVSDPDAFVCEITETQRSREPEELNGWYLSCDALAEAELDLFVVDDEGEVLGGELIDIRVPDGFELHAAAPMFLSSTTDADSLTHTPQVLAGGTATFEVRWFSGSERLYGNDVLDSDSVEGLETVHDTTYLFEDREWIQLTPAEPGTLTVPLYADAAAVDSFELVVVDESAIDHVELHGEDESLAEEEDPLVVVAQAYDAADAPIYGVAFSWLHDGELEDGLGDLYRYSYDPDYEADLEAWHGELGNAVTIHGEGYVDSSNNLGCQSVAAAPWLGSLIFFVLFGRRRR